MRVISRRLNQQLTEAQNSQLLLDYQCLKKQLPKFLYISVQHQYDGEGNIKGVINNGPAIAAIIEESLEEIYISKKTGKQTI